MTFWYLSFMKRQGNSAWHEKCYRQIKLPAGKKKLM